MGKQIQASTIELNGKRYNAQTGRAIDGFQKAVTAVKTSQVASSAHKSVRHVAAQSKKVHKTIQNSHTLMRHAVKKPSTITDRKTVAMDVVSHGQATIEAFHATDKTRLTRAATVTRNTLVSRFGDMSNKTTPHHKEPSNMNQISHAKQPTAQVQAIALPVSEQTTTSKLLDKGMREATSHVSHTAKKVKLRHKLGKKFGLSSKATSYIATGLSVIAFGGFIGYQNMSNLQVRYASMKSGVSAAMPQYQPSGFSVSNRVLFRPGALTINYTANTDKRSYSLTQQNTAWNSEALKTHIATTKGAAPQTFPDDGRTIFLHENSADWVNNGVWYSISGDASLNADQLIKIASSI